jgi:AcrR family transcriptional regulator
MVVMNATRQPDPNDRDAPQRLGTSSSAALSAPLGRQPLDRRTVMIGGAQLVDEEGPRSLTMRRLGARLGVQAMALYHYVSGRDDLLDGIVELVVDDLYGDPEVRMESGSWQDYLQRLAHGVRRIALDHPQIFPLIATRPPAAPWLRPPLRSLRWAESFLSMLKKNGFSDALAVESYRAFTSFLLGHLLLEVSSLGADIGPVEQEDPEGPTRIDLNDYPMLNSMRGLLSEDFSEDEFGAALEALLDRLDAEFHRARRS